MFRMLVHIGFERRGFVDAADNLQDVSQALSPWYGSCARRFRQSFWINLFGEFRKNCCRVIESPDMLRISHKVERCSFGRRHENRAARRIERLNGNFRDSLAHNEDDTNGSALNRAAIRRKTHLKFLGTMMRCAVVLRRRQKTSVIGHVKTLH